MSGTPIESPVYTLGTWQANVADEYGAEWVCEAEDGWSCSPPVRATLEDREADDGAWSGPGYYGPRVINLSGKAHAPSRAGMLAAQERLKAAINPRTLVQLRVDEAHLSRVAMVRLSDQIDIKDVSAHIFSWSLTVVAPDPRKYAAESVTATTTLPTGLTAGRTYSRTYPVVYGGVVPGEGGSVFVTQEGSYDLTPAVIVFTGPVISPRVEHVNSGRNLTFDLTVAYGETLTLDLLTKSALLNGSVNQAAAISPGSAWFMLSQGANELAFRGQAGTPPPDVTPAPVPLMTVTAASAWS
jgi:hypothetical protein